MDRILFLIFCIANVFVYSGVKYVHLIDKSYSTLEVMSYVNIVSFILILPYAFYKGRDVILKGKEHASFGFLPVTAMLKILALQYISVKSATVISFLIPIVTSFFAHLLLKERLNKHIKHYISMAISLVGVAIFVGPISDTNIFAYSIMILHVLLKAFLHIKIKKLSGDQYLALWFNILYYMIFAAAILLWKSNNFSISMLHNKYVIIIATISIICQLGLIWGYKVAKQITLLQNIDVSRIVVACIVSYFLFKEPITANNIVGLGILIFSLTLSELKYGEFFAKIIRKIIKI